MGLILVACAGCVALAPVETEPQPSSQDVEIGGHADGFGNISDFESEYAAVAKELGASLPEGYEFPASPPGDWENSAAFELGTGSMQAAFFWQCAWISDYVFARQKGDEGGMNKALDQLAEWVDLPPVTPNIDEESARLWLEVYINPAREGDDMKLLSMSSCNQ